MNTTLPKFQEEYSTKIPALVLLHTLGWQYLTPQQVLAARANKTRQVVLQTILRQQLQQRRFSYAGKLHDFSSETLDKAVENLCTSSLNEGLTAANEKLTDHLLYGIAVREFVDGKKLNPTLPIIDWQNIANNQFHITEEFTVLRQDGSNTRRPDIVCFVNGLPLAIIEAKRPDNHRLHKPTIDAGISQHLRNQQPDEIPSLYAYAQLLLSINGIEGQYGTQGTAKTFWTLWQEHEISEAQLQALKNTPLDAAAKALLFQQRPPQVQDWYEEFVAGGERLPTAQDCLLIGLLSPARLLEFTRSYIAFDKYKGKIVARYPQVAAIKTLLATIDTPASRQQTARQGGVIWHTTGSGKSLTMVLFSKTLLMHESLKSCRILLVTDRVDLENQLSTIFIDNGELSGQQTKHHAIARTGKHLADEISNGNERVIFTIINKFANAIKLGKCYNDSRDIVVLIDEGHRSQGGLNYLQMRRALPNAAFIAFTGIPLLKKSKTTSQFGPILESYTMQQAERDKMVTPLLYEERKPELAINAQAIDNWFDRLTVSLSTAQKTQLKRQYARKGYVYSAQERIELIAYDIANHFHNHIDEGLKGQLACDSKLSAVRYQTALDDCGLFKSALVMSAPDSREGNLEVDESTIPEVLRWWRTNVGSQDEKTYSRDTIERFDKDDDLKLIIVVDKLLTGFDEPKNTVLYIDKPLKTHNLIQAIARVNRLHPQKEFGYLIDYRGILAELDTTIAQYQNLANKTQGGFYIEDLQGLYKQMRFEYKRLPQLHTRLWNIFADVNNTGDIEQLRAVLVPKMEIHHGQHVDIHLQVREDFYQALSEFAKCYKVAAQSASFYTDTDFNETKRQHYQDTLEQLSFLRQRVKEDANESINLAEYDSKIKKLMDKQVVSLRITESQGIYAVNKLGQATPKETDSTDKTRNETDIIRTRVTRSIEQDLRDDPYAQQVFSQLLLQVIKEAEALFEHPLKQRMLFEQFEDKVAQRDIDGIPEMLAKNKHMQAYFGVLKLHYPDADDNTSQRWITLSQHIDTVITQAVAEFSLSPQDIEANIRQLLLPTMFSECKSLGDGMTQATAIINQIIEVMQHGRRS